MRKYASTLGLGTGTGFVHSRVTGPLNSHQTSPNLPYHSHSAVIGTPPQFVNSLNADMNSNIRQQALRANPGKNNLTPPTPPPSLNDPPIYYRTTSQRMVPVSSHVNYIPPTDADQRINRLKTSTIGSVVFSGNVTSTASMNQSTVRSSLRRARSSGAVAPRKKGASSVLTHGVGYGSGGIQGIRSTY